MMTYTNWDKHDTSSFQVKSLSRVQRRERNQRKKKETNGEIKRKSNHQG